MLFITEKQEAIEAGHASDNEDDGDDAVSVSPHFSCCDNCLNPNFFFDIFFVFYE